MANVIFEEGTQLQASGFTAGDTLLFKTAAPSDVAVTYNAPSGFSVATVTLTVGQQSLTFAAAALGDVDTNITFFAEDGQLVFGTAGDDATLAIASDADSAAYGFDGIDTIDVSGDGNHLVYGGAGADEITVTGGEGNHNIFGDAGDDEVDAGDALGSLNIFGGAGNDTLTGGAGNDHLYGQSAAGGTDGDDVIDGGDGNDYIQGNAGADDLNGGDGRDRINGGADEDTINGGDGNDTINGNKGDDDINGGDGNDSIRGGADNDVLQGGIGNDVLQGDLGDDTIAGGVGADVMTGGDGEDVFVFGTADASVFVASSVTFYDTITDFAVGTDKIALTAFEVVEDGILVQGAGISFDGTADGAAQAKIYATELLDGAADGSVAAIQVGADTYLYYDSDGEYTTDNTVDQIIVLKGVVAADLTVDDFAALVI